MSVTATPALTTAAATVALAVVAVAHRYAPGRGLEPVSFEAAAPAVIAITGANGAGKSTLLKIIAGLLTPSAGAITLGIAGRAIAPAARRLHVGLASPELAFYSELTVAENLEFAAAALGIGDPRGAVRDALAHVGLAGRAHDRAQTLSSGMVQRLRLGFALLQRPPVLLLDEPGSHLDDEGRALLLALIEREARARLIVIATNDEREWGRAEQRIELRGPGLGHPA